MLENITYFINRLLEHIKESYNALEESAKIMKKDIDNITEYYYSSIGNIEDKTKEYINKLNDLNNKTNYCNDKTITYENHIDYMKELENLSYYVDLEIKLFVVTLFKDWSAYIISLSNDMDNLRIQINSELLLANELKSKIERYLKNSNELFEIKPIDDILDSLLLADIINDNNYNKAR